MRMETQRAAEFPRRRPQCASKPNTLKRTISKCGIDCENGMMLSSSLNCPPKKVPHMAAPHGNNQLDPNEPILLPRSDRTSDQSEDDDMDEPEVSPLMFDWNDSPMAVNDRYYERVMEPMSLLSPSPHVFMYTPSDTASTVSCGSPSMLNPQLSALGEREYLSPASLHALVLDYLRDVFARFNRVSTFSFAQLGQMVQSFPSAFRQIQTIVKDRLGISWHLVGSFVENVLDFICDEDIRDATVQEFAAYLRNTTVTETLSSGNIFVNLCEYFHELLDRFKEFLVKLWLQTKRIDFPCEFGKKSATLFLCMECHREHL